MVDIDHEAALAYCTCCRERHPDVDNLMGCYEDLRSQLRARTDELLELRKTANTGYRRHSNLAEDVVRPQAETIEATRKVLSDSGHCGDGRLPSLVARALEEARFSASDQSSKIISDQAAAFSRCWEEIPNVTEGELHEAIAKMRRELSELVNMAYVRMVHSEGATARKWLDKYKKVFQGERDGS